MEIIDSQYRLVVWTLRFFMPRLQRPQGCFLKIALAFVLIVWPLPGRGYATDASTPLIRVPAGIAPFALGGVLVDARPFLRLHPDHARVLPALAVGSRRPGPVLGAFGLLAKTENSDLTVEAWTGLQ